MFFRSHLPLCCCARVLHQAAKNTHKGATFNVRHSHAAVGIVKPAHAFTWICHVKHTCDAATHIVHMCIQIQHMHTGTYLSSFTLCVYSIAHIPLHNRGAILICPNQTQPHHIRHSHYVRHSHHVRHSHTTRACDITCCTPCYQMPSSGLGPPLRGSAGPSSISYPAHHTHAHLP